MVLEDDVAVRRLLIALSLAAVACTADTTGYNGPHTREVRRAMRSIERSTGRKFKTPPRLEERTREQVSAFLEQSFNEHLTAAELAGSERSYKRFGLLPESLDLRKTLLAILEEQVAGYYDPKTKVLYVVRDANADLLAATIPHELVHALQDQYFPLDSLMRIHGDNDRQEAMQSVVEGQATWEQFAMLAGSGNPENAVPGGWDAVRQRIRSDHADMPRLAEAPTLLRETLLFPYLSGAEHIRQFKAKEPGGWPFDSLPESTEQVLHADQYFGKRDHPLAITVPPLRAGATSVYENNLGEFEMRLYFYELSHDLNHAAAASRGWGGDRYVLASLGGKSEALVWVTAWDTGLDAAEFVDALGDAIPVRYRHAERVAATGGRRRFEGAGRVVEITPVTVGGHSVVLFIDVPAGVSPDLVDAARIRITP